MAGKHKNRKKKPGESSSTQAPQQRSTIPGMAPPTGSGFHEHGDSASRTNQPSTSRIDLGPDTNPEPETTATGSDWIIDYKRREETRSKFPSKPKKGTNPIGKPIQLISNLYNIDIPKGNVYHYDIEIYDKRHESKTTGKETEKGKRFRIMNTAINRKVFEALMNLEPFRKNIAAYDGKKNSYFRECLDDLREQSVSIPSENPSKLENFTVRIQPVCKKETNDCAISLDTLHAFYHGRSQTYEFEAVMALETIMRHTPSLRYTPIYRSFYYPGRFIKPLGHDKEIRFGYHQSIRPGEKQLMVNLDIAATAFYKEQPLLSFIAGILHVSEDVLKRNPVDSRGIKEVNEVLKNVHISVTHYGTYHRTFKRVKLAPENSNQIKIDENGKTVRDYFAEKHKINLKYPHLPLVQQDGKKTYFPIEVCLVKSQNVKTKLSGKENAEMIKITAKPPADRFREIKDEVLPKADFRSDVIVRSFGIKVNPNPIGLTGRVLNTPALQYHESGDSRVVPRNGQWNMIGKVLKEGADIPHWCLLSLTGRHNESYLNSFCDELMKIAYNQGLKMEPPINVQRLPIGRVDDRAEGQIKKALEKAKNNDAKLVIVILPEEEDRGQRGKEEEKKEHERINNALYKIVKHISETQVGIMTQCVKQSNARRNASLLSNICLKLNCKMGGINHDLTVGQTPKLLNPRDPVIVFGADVRHTAPTEMKTDKNGEEAAESVAAVVASTSSKCNYYNSRVCIQTNKDKSKKSQEIILDLQNMAKELLEDYKKKNGLPNRVIFYRDGVSDGQLEIVVDREIRDVKKAFAKIDRSWKPKLTYIVLHKRHHVRFMPQNPRDGVPKTLNAPPGTVADSVVVNPKTFDFFMISQLGLQGTVKPTYYQVLADENGFTMDDMLKLTYHLCYTFVRCTKSISIPPPVQYADIIADRAKLWVDKEDKQNSRILQGPKQVQDDDGTHLGTIRRIDIPIEINNKMFFT